jgi:hypothetical protein
MLTRGPSKAVAVALLTMAAAFLLSSCAASEPVLPTPDPLSAADAERLIEEHLKFYANEARIADPMMQIPEVARVRFLDPSEPPEAIAQCLREEGFEAAVEPDGGLSGGYRIEQQAAFALALYVCNAKYPPDPKYLAPLNESQHEYVYDFLVKELVPCLAKEGFDVGEIPSLQAYLADAGTPREWVPMAEVSAPGWLQYRCEQVPDGLYGEIEDGG